MVGFQEKCGAIWLCKIWSCVFCNGLITIVIAEISPQFMTGLHPSPLSPQTCAIPCNWRPASTNTNSLASLHNCFVFAKRPSLVHFKSSEISNGIKTMVPSKNGIQETWELEKFMGFPSESLDNLTYLRFWPHLNWWILLTRPLLSRNMNLWNLTDSTLNDNFGFLFTYLLKIKFITECWTILSTHIIIFTPSGHRLSIVSRYSKLHPYKNAVCLPYRCKP